MALASFAPGIIMSSNLSTINDFNAATVIDNSASISHMRSLNSMPITGRGDWLTTGKDDGKLSM